MSHKLRVHMNPPLLQHINISFAPPDSQFINPSLSQATAKPGSRPCSASVNPSSKLLVRAGRISWHQLVMCATAVQHQAHCHEALQYGQHVAADIAKALPQPETALAEL